MPKFNEYGIGIEINVQTSVVAFSRKNSFATIVKFFNRIDLYI